MHALGALDRLCRGAIPGVGTLGIVLLLLCAAAASGQERYVALSNLRFNVTLPTGGFAEERFTAAEFQRDVVRFLEGRGPPPLSSAFRLVIHTGLHEVMMHDCIACFVVAHLLVAETLLFTAPPRAMEIVENMMGLIGEWSPQSWENNAWGLQALINRIDDAHALASALPAGPVASGPALDVVVARCGEDLGWLLEATLAFPEGLTRLFLRDKCQESPVPAAVLAALRARFWAGVDVQGMPNQGMESLAYTRHLRQVVDGGVSPAEYTLFLQAEPFKHLDRELLEGLLQALSARTLSNTNVRFLHLNNMRFTTVQSFCLMDVYKRLIPEPPDPHTLFGAYCCSQFLVHRERISKVPVATVRTVQGILGDPTEPRPRDLACVQDNSHDARPGIAMSALFETLWQVVFGVGPMLPLRQDDDSLPLFLRDAHDWSDGRGEFDYHRYYQAKLA